MTAQTEIKVKQYDYRCNRCGRRLFRAFLAPHSRVTARCPKCGQVLVVKMDPATRKELDNG